MTPSLEKSSSGRFRSTPARGDVSDYKALNMTFEHGIDSTGTAVTIMPEISYPGSDGLGISFIL